MIRRLPPDIIREIAAGEVVSAPVDALKELFENALDAGATRLEVSLIAGGTESIVVADNGAGIPKEELPLAVEAHSTSKLASLEEICTLGFRGEGLYAIRNAARLTLTSRTATQLGGATIIADGDALKLSEHPAPTGTRAEVTDLFAQLPARRAALESPAAEGKKALALVSRYLLHRPELRLKLLMDNDERLTYAGGTGLEAAKLLWGAVTANRLLPLKQEAGGYRLSGLLSRPELTRPRRDRLFLAVNGRPVEWPESLLKAVLRAYGELLTSNHYPVGVLNLDLPAREVLVNTAPDKSRVKFMGEGVAEFIEQAIKSTLSAHPLAAPLPELRPLEPLQAAPRHGFPLLTYLGRYRELYLLAEADGELWVVDAHAAHERILYEELSRRYREEPPLELSAPELLTLTPEEEGLYLERHTELNGLGLVLEPFGGGQWRLRSVPAFLSAHPDLCAEVIKGSLAHNSTEEAWRRVLARLACLPALRAGQALTLAEGQALLDTLLRCETPWACPHGRPTALVLSELELARRFGRRGVRAVMREPKNAALQEG